MEMVCLKNMEDKTIEREEKKKKFLKEKKRILESKKIIKEEKKKIKLEKKHIREKKRAKFKKTKLGKLCYLFSNDKNNYSFQEVFGITIVSLILGFFACCSFMVIVFHGRNYFRFRDLIKFYDVYQVLVDDYFGDVDKDELISSAINGMVSSVGDVYTSYGDADTAVAFNQMVNGTYEGIGCTIQQLEDGVKVIEVYEDSPAYEAGIKPDDFIKSVDELVVPDANITELSNYIMNEASGDIKIVVIRDSEELTFNLKRGKVELPSVKAKTIDVNDKKIGYIDIDIFSSVSAKQFEKKIKELEKEKINGLVIDVRDNNGGYLSSVTDIASYLLPKGKIIYQVSNGSKQEATKDKTNDKRSYPIAILVNGGSASASEVLTGAIKESYGGYVFGTTTFGKGTVQQVRELPDGSMFKYTIEKWLTPDGNWINEKGIEPTDEVELDEGYFENPTEENDNQLQKALELVSE